MPKISYKSFGLCIDGCFPITKCLLTLTPVPKPLRDLSLCYYMVTREPLTSGLGSYAWVGRVCWDGAVASESLTTLDPLQKGSDWISYKQVFRHGCWYSCVTRTDAGCMNAWLRTHDPITLTKVYISQMPTPTHTHTHPKQKVYHVEFWLTMFFFGYVVCCTYMYS